MPAYICFDVRHLHNTYIIWTWVFVCLIVNTVDVRSVHASVQMTSAIDIKSPKNDAATSILHCKESDEKCYICTKNTFRNYGQFFFFFNIPSMMTPCKNDITTDKGSQQHLDLLRFWDLYNNWQKTAVTLKNVKHVSINKNDAKYLKKQNIPYPYAWLKRDVRLLER